MASQPQGQGSRQELAKNETCIRQVVAYCTVTAPGTMRWRGIVDVAMCSSRRPEPGTTALEQEMTDRRHQDGRGDDSHGRKQEKSFGTD